ncbi:putative serine/threonine protein kinase [[Actinomadura] parvosata subsp. kistnae]|nr:putative serine/threonine protein kinase [Actinomadura parvosata subsp. kistnae]
MSERLGPYELLSRLGAGGFGEVHLALDPEGRTVAVKVLHPHVAADGGALARLAREVETMRMVGGPHVAEVLDASLTGGRPYLVTRYVQGRPLSSVPLPVADLRRLASGLADALHAMHEAGVVHRDLKPANVMMTEGEPVVIDFGIASALDSLSVTASGAVVGTPGYLAPEVLEGRAVGTEADVFAFGATMAYAATGRHPYGQGPASAVAYRVVHHPPDLEGVPEWLEPLLRECLDTDPPPGPRPRSSAPGWASRPSRAPLPGRPPGPAGQRRREHQGVAARQGAAPPFGGGVEGPAPGEGAQALADRLGAVRVAAGGGRPGAAARGVAVPAGGVRAGGRLRRGGGHVLARPLPARPHRRRRGQRGGGGGAVLRAGGAVQHVHAGVVRGYGVGRGDRVPAVRVKATE